jgi:tRNA/tmRNA/rRNA uracil-C5-methylase (TrmA/RlmC/RlmD family)
MTDASVIVGTRLELTVGPIAHGGHCVARMPASDGSRGMVVFVRHTLPGERVIAEVTEVQRGYLRADALTVIEAAPQRVPAPCPHAGPNRCGGCDFQHIDPEFQRQLKGYVVREQLIRLGRLTEADVDELAIRVEALPGGPLGWRTRLRYAISDEGRAGLFKHRSHEVVPIDRCLIAHPAIQELPITEQLWPTPDELEVIAASNGVISVLSTTDGVGDRIMGPYEVVEHAAGRDWSLAAGGFWQVHPAAADIFARTVNELLSPKAGETAWDLYGGAGLFAAGLATAVGPAGMVTLVEADARGAATARRNLADLPVTIKAAPVEKALRHGLPKPDLVVLDPPRSGAGARVVRGIIGARPRAVGYVACDPAAFARDVHTFREGGWRLAVLRVFDAFPMTHHVECIGLLVPSPG